MSLINTGDSSKFNKDEIQRGFAIWARRINEPEGRTGFVNSVTDSSIVANFAPGINNVVNHFIVNAEEVAGGEWEIRYSQDLSTVYEYPEKDSEGF